MVCNQSLETDNSAAVCNNFGNVLDWVEKKVLVELCCFLEDMIFDCNATIAVDVT